MALDRAYYEEKTSALVERIGIPMVSGSDTHQAVQYGCIRTNMYKTVTEVNKLYKEIKQGNYGIVVSSKAEFQVKAAGLLKKTLKEIHMLGGDYISVLTSSE